MDLFSIETANRKGFLPIVTSIGDRIFISAILAIGVIFIWMRFLEPIIGLSGAIVLDVILAFIILKWG